MSDVEKVDAVQDPEQTTVEPTVEPAVEQATEELSEVQKAAREKRVVEMGGGAVACVTCEKRSYPAETIYMEGLPRHKQCFFCTECNKKMENTVNAAVFDYKLYCAPCFGKKGFARQQATVKWSGGSQSGAKPVNPAFAKLGGGGNKCTSCEKTVYSGEMVSYDGLPYHPDCLCCTDCGNKTTVTNVNKYDGQLKCLPCWNTGGYNRKQLTAKADGSTSTAKPVNPAFAKFGGGGNKCVVCEKTVYSGEAVSYDNQPYHPGCLCCTDCGNKTTVTNVNKYDGQLKCLPCWNTGGYNRKQLTAKADGSASAKPVNPAFAKFGGGGSKCTVCEKTVYSGESVSYDNMPYHPDCLCCTDCGNKTTVTNVNKFEGQLKCLPCWNNGGYNRKQLSIAKNENAPAKPVNPALARFGGGGSKCTKCAKTVYAGEIVSYDGLPYHPDCIACTDCGNKTAVANVNKFEGELKCLPCWNNGGYARKQLLMK